MTSGNGVSSQESLKLQHALSRLLPDSTPVQEVTKLASQIYRSSVCTSSELHDAPRLRDAVWHQLRPFGITPTSADLDDIIRFVKSINSRVSKLYPSLPPEDSRLSVWNDASAALFDHLLLSTNVAHRVQDPRSETPPSNNRATPSSSAGRSDSHSNALRATTASSSSTAPTFDPSWLRKRCAQLEIVRAGGLPAHEMAVSVLTLLTDSARTDDHIQSDLFDAFGGDFDAVGDVLQHRSQFRRHSDAVAADCAQAYEFHIQGLPTDDVSLTGHSSSQHSSRHSRGSRTTLTIGTQPDRRRDSRDRRRQGRSNAGAFNSDDEEEIDEKLQNQLQLGMSAYEERQRAFPGVQMDRDAIIGAVDKISLPKGSTRTIGEGFEEIFVPPPERRPVLDSELVDVRSGLADHPYLLTAMKGVTSLNRLQSAVFPIAFHSNENLLVCAPTGAGKTNVALLTIFREIVAVKTREKLNFKVVYVAPMKALAAEVTEKFSQRLGPLGLLVREFTGDMSLTRAESLETHVLVTTPEKWDVVTRKSGSEVGEAVTLFIVDEIHLLHDDRGAVLESIVARTLRFSETAQKQIRLVGLSATLPNYKDVGSFLRVNPGKGLFHFDGSHRPVPLSQTFIGVSEGVQSNTNEARRRKEAKIHELAWKKVKDSLQRGHQAMIFVHSRKGTSNAAREMISRATQDAVGEIFLGGASDSSGIKSGVMEKTSGDETDSGESSMRLPSWAAKEISKSKTADIRELCSRGVGIHNAGLPRSDRVLVEKLFAEGVLRLLCCTATLAWGVNLPARTVVIMGTEVYNAEKGKFVQLGMLDVMQIFGRAGRPQFDTQGEGTIITEHEHLSTYLNLLTSSLPIESQLSASPSRMADHLNAEIVSGTVSSIADGTRWLGYTYLSVRMPQNPQVYGIDWQEVHLDYQLLTRREKLIKDACKELDDARMCRYDPEQDILSPTDLGRVASHFYVSHETIVLWSELLDPERLDRLLGPSSESATYWNRVYREVIHAVSCATEFEQMRSRQEELEDLGRLMKNACPLPLKPEFGSETREGKVAILMQAHISRANIKLSDVSYVVQSATRLLRALFEISLRRGIPAFTLASLELARASESRIWPHQHPLWQFTYLSRRERGLFVTPETIASIESNEDEYTISSLRAMTREDLSVLIRAPKIVQTVEKVLRTIPTLEIVSANVALLSGSLLSVRVRLFPNFRWHDSVHGKVEAWWIWIEDKKFNRIYLNQKILLTKKQVQSLNSNHAYDNDGQHRKTIDYNFTVATFDPPSPQYWVRVEADRWHTGGGSMAMLSVASVQFPKEERLKSNLSSVNPASVQDVVPGDAAKWFGKQFSHFTPPHMAALHVAMNTNENIVISAPHVCGKFVIAEFAMFHAFKEGRNACIVFISPDEGTLVVREKNWKALSVYGRGHVVLLDHRNIDAFSPESISSFSILLTTPNTWVDFVRRVDEKVIFNQVSLFILNDLHRLSEGRYTSMEAFLTRLCRYRHSLESEKAIDVTPVPRLLGLCEVLPNAAQVGNWLGASRKSGLLCLGPEAKPIDLQLQLISVAGDRYSSRMQSMNRPLFSTVQRRDLGLTSVLVFVGSRRQTLLTARDLLRLALLEGSNRFLTQRGGSEKRVNVSRHLRVINDAGLREMVPNGIGLLHESLSSAEVGAMEALFENGNIQILVATYGMASRMKIRAQSVIVKGTEVFNPGKQRFEDISSGDLVEMIGLAGRMDVDTMSFATVFVHEPKLTLFKKLLYDPLPVESGLLEHKFNEILLQEIVAGRIWNIQSATEWLSNSFFFQRLKTNPGYYGLKKKGRDDEISQQDAKIMASQRRNAFCQNIVVQAVKRLDDFECLMVDGDPQKLEKGGKFSATKLGQLCDECSVKAETVQVIKNNVLGCTEVEDVIDMICRCNEVEDCVLEFDDETAWVRLYEKISEHFVECGLFANADTAGKSLKLTGWADSTQKRTKLLIYSLMIDGGGSLKEIRSNRSLVLETACKVTNAAVEVAGMLKCYAGLKCCTRTLQGLKNRRIVNQDIWTLIGLNGGSTVEKMRAGGWNKMDDIWKDETAFAMAVSRTFENEMREMITRWLRSYPRVRIERVETNSRDKSVKDNNNGSIIVEFTVRSNGASNEDWYNKKLRFVVAAFHMLRSELIVMKRTEVGCDSKHGLSRSVVHLPFTGDVNGKVVIWVGSEDFVSAEAETEELFG